MDKIFVASIYSPNSICILKLANLSSVSMNNLHSLYFEEYNNTCIMFLGFYASKQALSIFEVLINV